MLFAEIENGVVKGVMDTDTAYPGGGWEIIRPLLEDAGVMFVEVTDVSVQGTHYDTETGEFYTPEDIIEPTEMEILQARIVELEAKLDAQTTKLESIESTQTATIMAVMDIGMAVVPPPESP